MIRIPTTGGGRYLVPLLVLVGAAAATQVARELLETRGVAADLATAILLDVVASQVGAPWHGRGRDTKELLRGAGLGLTGVLATTLVAVTIGRATLAPGAPTPLTVPFALVVSAAFAVRSGLLYLWLPDRLLGGFRGKDVVLALGFVAPSVLTGRWAPLLPLAALGALAVVLLRRSRSPLPPIGALFGVHLGATLVAPSVLGVRFASGSITPPDRASSEAALWLTAGLVALTVGAWRVAGRGEARPT